MKRITLLLCLICCVLLCNAQVYVSTTPSNRNVILEEWTGINCTWCPAGHLIANNIHAQYPDRFWAVNIHAGGFSPTSYPNLQCADGITIHNASGVNAYPTGTINRSTSTPQGRDQWAATVSTMLAQPSPLNIGGIAVIDPGTNIATITIEVYYTADGTGPTNQLSVMMLQDNILGPQTGMSQNPAQVIGGQYNHMHILRDVITATWGDVISPVTAGTLITKTYEYQIPDIIGNPNGVATVVENMNFVAFVSATNTNIISAQKIETIIGSNEPIHPAIKAFNTTPGVYCSEEKLVDVDILNAGLDEITSMEFEFDVNGVTSNTTWEGSIPSYEKQTLQLSVTAPDPEQTVTITIVKTNGQSVAPNVATVASTTILNEESIAPPDKVESFTLRLWQDKFGNQITWEMYANDNSIINQGGPYEILGANGTKLHEEEITFTAANSCVKFAIHDAGCNGFNGTTGQGHYEIVDNNGNLIYESDGKIGCGETVNFAIVFGQVGITNHNNSVVVYPNPAKDHLLISNANNVSSAKVFDITGKVVLSTSVINNYININNLEKGIYILNLTNTDNTSSNVKFVKE